MNSTEFENLLARYLMARIPFVAVNTTERSRVLELIRKVADATRLPVYVHTLSEGMYEILQARTANEGRTVYEAVDFISQQIRQRENLTFVMTEVSSLDDDSDNARQFYDLVALAEKHAATIIVITSKPVWSQLMRLGMAMTLDFPDEQEMHTIIRESIEPYIRDIRVEWDDADYREAASILAGISRIEAQNVIATLIASAGRTQRRRPCGTASVAKRETEAACSEQARRAQGEGHSHAARYPAGGCAWLWEVAVSKGNLSNLEDASVSPGLCHSPGNVCWAEREPVQGSAGHSGACIAVHPVDR